jgi:hypothetical protein
VKDRSEEALFEVYAFSPLVNFWCNVSEMALPDGIVVGYPTDRETSIMGSDRRNLLCLLSSAPKFIVCTGLRKFENEDRAESELQGILYDFLTALRLFKRGSVGFATQYLQTSPQEFLLLDSVPWSLAVEPRK